MSLRRVALPVAAACLVSSALGCGGSTNTDQILWSVKVNPLFAGRSREPGEPYLASDGRIYVGGAIDDKSGTARLYVVSPDGVIERSLDGTNGAHHGAPPIWVTENPTTGVVYAVDEDGGLYAMRPDGNDLYHPPSERMFENLRRPDAPKIIGPAVAGVNGEVFVGGSEQMHIVFIESRRNPYGTSIPCGDVSLVGLYPNGAVYCLGSHGVRTDNGAGRSIGRGPQSSFGIPPRFAPRGGPYRLDPRNLRVFGPTPNIQADLVDYASSDVRTSSAGQVYVTTRQKLVAYDQSLTKLWEMPTRMGLYNAVVPTEDGLYITDHVGNLIALDLDGVERWRITLPGYCASPTLGADGTIYTSCRDGLLYAIKPPAP